MNIKKHLVNTTSNTLSMIALVGGMTMFAGQAHAWGDREQGILTGIIGTLIIQDINRGGNNRQHYPQQQHNYQQAAPVYNNNTTVIIQDSAWASTRVCSEEIVNSGGGVRSTIQRNCAGRVVGVIDYKRY
jgi:hypothetical protein